MKDGVLAPRGMSRGGSRGAGGEGFKKREKSGSQDPPEMEKEVTGNRVAPERKRFSVSVSYSCITNHLKTG